jgi:hypothetical protein
MKHIKEAVTDFLKRSGLGARQEEHFIHENWADIAGSDLSKQSEPYKLDGRKLFIYVENSVIMSEIIYKKKALRDKINLLFKADKVKDIIFRIKQ